MRIPLIAGNWKMYKTTLEAKSLVNEILEKLDKNINDREILFCPPFTAISTVGEIIKDSIVELGAQNVYFEKEGAYTGEISPLMLRDLGCTYVIIGHSERRKYFNETDEFLNKKIQSAINNNLKPILCVGESLEIRDKGETISFVVSQIKNCLKNITKEDSLKIVIAYEPIWAIGTGRNDTPQNANQTIKAIRDELENIFGYEISQKIRILYGGSVKPENIDSYMSEKEIDGALVGGASLKADSFLRIINFVK